MRKINWIGIVSSLLVTIAFGLLGSLVGCGIVSAIQSDSFEWWQSLGKPAAGPFRFFRIEPISYNNHTLLIYVQTPTGSVFSCCTRGNGHWEEVNSPVERQQLPTCQGFQDPTTKHPTFSNLPSRIEDCTKMSWYWEWVVDDDFFVILEDGGVWKWNYYNGFAQVIGFVCGTPFAAIAIGWMIIIIAKRKQVARAEATSSAQSG